MSEPMRAPMRHQLLSGRRRPPVDMLPGVQSPSMETPIPGHLCEVCLDAPATRLQPAPWGGEMGVCELCATPGAQPQTTRSRTRRETHRASHTQERAMEPQSSGRLHWDTTHAATPGWLLFLDGQPGDAPTMLPGFETSLPRDASHTEVAHLIGEMLARKTGHRPQQVQVTPMEDGSG